MSIWSLTYQQSVFKRYHSDKHFSEFYLQDGGKNQPAQIGNKRVQRVHCRSQNCKSTMDRTSEQISPVEIRAPSFLQCINTVGLVTKNPPIMPKGSLCTSEGATDLPRFTWQMVIKMACLKAYHTISFQTEKPQPSNNFIQTWSRRITPCKTSLISLLQTDCNFWRYMEKQIKVFESDKLTRSSAAADGLHNMLYVSVKILSTAAQL